MKVLILFLVYLTVSNGASISKSDTVGIDGLVETALEFQNEINLRQENIDSDLIEFRTSVYNVQKWRTKQALEEVADNAMELFQLEQPVRVSVNGLKAGDCQSNLEAFLNKTTEYTDFESSNCLKFYNNFVEKEIQSALDSIDTYDRIFTEFKARIRDWETIRPNIENIIDALNDEIDDINTKMVSCFTDVQKPASEVYDYIASRVATCQAFDNVLGYFQYDLILLTIEDILLIKQAK